jgi:hypothetical protein
MLGLSRLLTLALATATLCGSVTAHSQQGPEVHVLGRTSFTCWGMIGGRFTEPQDIRLVNGTLYDRGTAISSFVGLNYDGGRVAIHRIERGTLVRYFYQDRSQRRLQFSSVYNFATGEVFDLDNNGTRTKICSNRRG